MKEQLEIAGYEIVPFKEGADIYIINTCTVTDIADENHAKLYIKQKNITQMQ